MCNCVACFLHQRRFRVFCDGRISKCLQINAGVPQGSLLSPTLFYTIQLYFISWQNPLLCTWQYCTWPICCTSCGQAEIEKKSVLAVELRFRIIFLSGMQKSCNEFLVKFCEGISSPFSSVTHAAISVIIVVASWKHEIFSVDLRSFRGALTMHLYRYSGSHCR